MYHSLFRFRRLYVFIVAALCFLVGRSFADETFVRELSNIPIPAPFGLEGGSAATGDPISLFNGAVSESVVDLSLPTPLKDVWRHKRTYNSGMTTGIAERELVGLQGPCWLGGNQANVLSKNADNISFIQSASNKRTFTGVNDAYVAPSDFDATLVKTGEDASEEFILTFNKTLEVNIYYGFNTMIPAALRGKLKERTNLQQQDQNLFGELYSYDERGLVTVITTAAPQAYSIVYTYDEMGLTLNRLSKIEIFTGLPDDPGSVIIAKAEYVYHDESLDKHQDVGSFGDLIQVKVSALTSDRTSTRERTITSEPVTTETFGTEREPPHSIMFPAPPKPPSVLSRFRTSTGAATSPQHRCSKPNPTGPPSPPPTTSPQRRPQDAVV